MALGGGFGAGLVGGAGTSVIGIIIRAQDDYSKEMAKAQKATEKMGGEFSKTTFLASKLSTIGYAAVATAVISVGVASVKAAAQLEPIKKGFEDLTTGSQHFLRELQVATEGTATQFELMKAANNALLLGIDQDKLPGMFKAAAIIGQAAGRTTEEAMNDITLGIARQSRLILDNIGIIVDAETAYKKFAEANNIVGRSLTDVEKKLAFQTEAVFQAEQKAIALGGTLEKTLNYELDRMRVNLNEITVALGESISEGGFKQFVGGVNDAIDAVQRFNAQPQMKAELQLKEAVFLGQLKTPTEEQIAESFRQVPLREKKHGPGGYTKQINEDIALDETRREIALRNIMAQEELLVSQGKLTSVEQSALDVKNEQKEVVDELVAAEIAYKVGMENLTETGGELILKQIELKNELQKVRDESYAAVPALQGVSREISKLVNEEIKKTGETGGGITPKSKGGSSGYNPVSAQYGLDLISMNPAARANAIAMQSGNLEQREYKVVVKIDGADHVKTVNQARVRGS